MFWRNLLSTSARTTVAAVAGSAATASGVDSDWYRRLDKPAFQREIVRYLRSGSAYLWTRGDGLQVTPATAERLRSAPVLFRDGRWVLHAVVR